MGYSSYYRRFNAKKTLPVLKQERFYKFSYLTPKNKIIMKSLRKSILVTMIFIFVIVIKIQIF